MKIIEILKTTFENLDSLIPNIKSFQEEWYFSKLSPLYTVEESKLDGMPNLIHYDSKYYQQWFGLESEFIFTGITIFVPDDDDYQRYYYDLNNVLNFRLKVYSNITSDPIPLPISEDTYFNLLLKQEMKITYEELVVIEKYLEDYKEVITKYKLQIEIVMR